MFSALGASICRVWFLVITKSWVETYASRLSQSGLVVITASTLTRSHVGLFKIKVADWLVPPEPQAASDSKTASHAT